MIIVITGTRKGIGRYLAEHYLGQGHNVIGCSRDTTTLSHSKYYHYYMDVSDEKDVRKMFFGIKKNFGSIDVLINNAGVASMNHSFLMHIKTIYDIIDTNIVGTFLCSREAAKIMKDKKRGKIINFTSFAVPFKLEGEAVYAASKAAVITLTEVLSKEYAPFGITVNAVAPAATKTDLVKNVPENTMNNLLKRQTIHRYCEFHEIVNVIDFFINNDMITGETVYMGGI